MDALAQGAIELVAAFIIGMVMLLFGRRLFWLMGGLAMAVIGLTIALLVVFLIVISRYPTLLQALPEALQVSQTAQSATVDLQLPDTIPAPLVEEADQAINAALSQFGVLVLLVGLVGAIAGSLILIRLPKVASAVVGFVSGIWLTLLLLDMFSVNLPEWLRGLVALAIGIVCAIIGWRNPDTSLIAFSTQMGANLIVTGLRFDLNTSFSAIFWLALMLLGIIYQTGSLRRRQAKARQALAMQPNSSS
jgi:hypothetical protein